MSDSALYGISYYPDFQTGRATVRSTLISYGSSPSKHVGSILRGAGCQFLRERLAVSGSACSTEAARSFRSVFEINFLGQNLLRDIHAPGTPCSPPHPEPVACVHVLQLPDLR